MESCVNGFMHVQRHLDPITRKVLVYKREDKNLMGLYVLAIKKWIKVSTFHARFLPHASFLWDPYLQNYKLQMSLLF